MNPNVKPDKSLMRHMEEDRPKTAPGILSHSERWRHLERAFHGLYRWYTERSQRTRNWNPDTSFDWRNLRQDHSEEVHTILEGYFAVEQYVPDYVMRGLEMMRKSYGRSQFHLRWGSEEEKHADLWRNSLLFAGKRDREWVEEYDHQLRGQEWQLPWEDPIHMMFYTVFQERATQLNYVNLGLVAKGEWEHEAFKNDEDPVLAEMCKHIAADEAAHYNFFLEGARLFLYYFPEKAVECMADVLRHFAMPARDIIPNYDKFGEILHRTAVFGLRQHHRDVVKVGLEQLGAENLRKVEEGIRKSREVPDEQGKIRRTTIFETLDFQFIENKVKRLFKKVQDFEGQIGLDKVAPTHLIANPELTAYLTGKSAPEPA